MLYYFKFFKYLKDGAPSVIYAFGTTEMTRVDQDLYYHGSVNRGSQKLNILSKPTTYLSPPSDSHYVDFSIKHVNY